METKQYRAAGGVVVQQGLVPELALDQPYVLLLDRPSRNEVRLPKGHIDAGESAQEAALRETAEESGYIDLDVLADLGKQVVAYDYKGAHYVRHERYFLMRLRSVTQGPRSEHDAGQFIVRWASLSGAADQLTYEAEQEWVQRAITALQSLAP